jgi:hypothetical protein
MAKTDLTREIEKALRYYAPRELGGIKINVFRGRTTAFEVPVECGTNTAGMIDCVRINEYFGDKERVRVCRCHAWKRDGVRRIPINCPKGIADSDKTPELCDNDRCRWNIWKEVGRPKVLIQCFEIKITKSDFKSKNGHNFVGNLNYYVIPSELYEAIKDDVPEHIGIILYLKGGGLRRKRDATFREMTEEDQKWMILNVLKRIRRE